jgi:hypothetical protein
MKAIRGMPGRCCGGLEMKADTTKTHCRHAGRR